MSPLRARLEAVIETAIELLDRMDADADLEDGADDEPSLSFWGDYRQGVNLDDAEGSSDEVAA